MSFKDLADKNNGPNTEEKGKVSSRLRAALGVVAVAAGLSGYGIGNMSHGNQQPAQQEISASSVQQNQKVSLATTKVGNILTDRNAIQIVSASGHEGQSMILRRTDDDLFVQIDPNLPDNVKESMIKKAGEVALSARNSDNEMGLNMRVPENFQLIPGGFVGTEINGSYMVADSHDLDTLSKKTGKEYETSDGPAFHFKYSGGKIVPSGNEVYERNGPQEERNFPEPVSITPAG